MIFENNRPLLDAFRRGEKEALLSVYRFYVQDVASFLRRGFSFQSQGKPCSFRGFRGGYEVEAAIQEAFRRAFEERARLAYNGLDPYRPYLLRIARNMVINDLKAKQPILFRFRAGAPLILMQEDSPEDLASSMPGPDERAEAKEVFELVQAFRDNLNDREAGVFRVRFEEGLSSEAAAARLNLTRSKVRTTEAKLKKRFLRHMQSSGYLQGFTPSGDLAADVAKIALFLVVWGTSR